MKNKVIIIVLFIIGCCLVYQKLVPTNIGEVMSQYLMACDELSVVCVENSRQTIYTASNDEQLKEIQDWASDILGKYSSIGDDFFSNIQDIDHYTFYFKTADGQITSLTITTDGRFAEALKRYKIMNFSDQLLYDLSQIIISW